MSKELKNYLTQDLISQILLQSKDPIWKMGVLAAFKNNWFSIIAVSPLDLVHFYGNPDTGWEHIQNRHGYHSDALYFGKGALGNPSKFTPNSIPIFDYVNIADDVFTNGSIDTKEHPDSDKFIKYTGQSSRFTGSDGELKDFVLILYRGTKIVHSIFPKKYLQGKASKKVLENLSRAKHLIRANMKLMGEIVSVYIPYLNEKLVERYVIIIQMDINTSLCDAHLQINWPNGQPYYCIHTLLKFNVRLTRSDVETNSINFTRFLNGLGYSDFGHIEDIILRTELRLFSA